MTDRSVAAYRKLPASAPSRLAAFGLGILRSDYFILYLSFLYAICAYPFVPQLFTLEVAGNIVSEMMPLLIVAIGQTFVLVIAGIDLSVTAIIGLAAVVGASVMTQTGGYVSGPLATPAALLAMILVGAAVGFANGAATSRLRVPSFLVTLATRMFFAGAAVWYTTFHTASSSIADLPPPFIALADGYIFSFSLGNQIIGLPIEVAIAAAVVVIAHLTLNHSTLGRAITAVGANPRTAMVSGIRVERTITLAFVISGVCAAIAGMLYSSRMETGSPITGENILLDVIGAVVIGGTSLFGGKGKIIWTVFGVFFLVLLDMTLKLIGASLFVIYIIKGSVILVAAAIDTLRNRIFAER
jgi:ribose/xylose/arabinose/galactoside ABC-type transport system permease subunit